MDDEQVSMAAVMLARALGIDPAAMMLAVRPTPFGVEVRLTIVPDVDETDDGLDGATGADVVAEAERMLSNGQ